MAEIAQAQRPLSIEQLLVQAEKWQVGASFDYLTATPGPWTSQSVAGQRVALRYGIAPNLELSAGLQRSRREDRLPGGSAVSNSQSLGVGMNWLLKGETAIPALLLEVRADIAREDNGRRSYLAAGQLMLTAYKSVDPVVLSVTALWDQRRGYHGDDGRVQPGHRWHIEPAVNFAVNPEVTLLGGLSLSRRFAHRVEGRSVSAATEQVALRAGLACALGPDSRVFLTGGFAGNAAASSVTLQWFYDF